MVRPTKCSSCSPQNWKTSGFSNSVKYFFLYQCNSISFTEVTNNYEQKLLYNTPVEVRVKFILVIDVDTWTSLKLYISSVEINPTWFFQRFQAPE